MDNNRAHKNLIFTILHICMFVVLSLVADYIIFLLSGSKQDVEEITKLDWLLAIFIVPVIETWIFQKVPIDITYKESNTRPTIVIIVLGLIFSIFHFRGLLHTVPIFISGTYLAFLYYKLKQLDYYPFLVTVIAHMLLNLVILIGN